MSTIYALSSGRPPCGVAVVRLSGPRCRFVVETMCGALPAARTVALKSIRDRSGRLLDRGLVMWFPGPASYTGEDMAELQVHGGRAVVAAVGAALAAFEGVREAEAGEFTRRAFLAGKIDLTEAEGLADLLAAETEAQRAQALAQSAGALRQLYEGWRERLIEAWSLVEAGLDFAEEEDISAGVIGQALVVVGELRSAILAHLADAHRGERLRDGFQVVLLGRPNAGKSSLLNALARRDVAIVSEEAGTTRDLVEVHLDLGGYPVTVIDTAGLRRTEGGVEREGIRRALDRGREADLVLWLVAADDVAEGAMPDVGAVPVWRIDSKCDLASSGVDEGVRPGDVGATARQVSARTGAGLDALIAALAAEVASTTGGREGPAPTRERHRRLLTAVLGELERAEAPGLAEDLIAEHLRRAGDQVARLTGRIDVEDLLESIFGTFCVGK